VVPGGIADIVEVIMLAACPHHLLRGDRTGIGSRLETCEHVLELVHARVREHQGRIVAGHQRSGLDHFVIVFLEIVQKG